MGAGPQAVGALSSPFRQARGWKRGSPRGEKDAGPTWVFPLPVFALVPPTVDPRALIPDM